MRHEENMENPYQGSPLTHMEDPNKRSQTMTSQEADSKKAVRALLKAPNQHPRRTQTKDTLGYTPKNHNQRTQRTRRHIRY